MKKSTLFLVLLALLTASCSARVLFETDNDKVASAAAEIASFELPGGFAPDYVAAFGDYTLVSYVTSEPHSHLFLIQSLNSADAGKLEQAIEDIVPGDRDPQARMTVLETRPVTVRGEETTLVISEGINGDGETYRQAAVAFTGNGGPALLVYSTPLANWILETVENLLASIQ